MTGFFASRTGPGLTSKRCRSRFETPPTGDLSPARRTSPDTCRPVSRRGSAGKCVGETFWLIAQRGRDADWVRNIEADPRVRVKVSGLHAGWRSGTARILDDDDPEERQRILSQASLARRLCLSTSKAQNTNPLTIRVDLDSE